LQVSKKQVRRRSSRARAYADGSENAAPGLTPHEPDAPGNRYALAMPFGIGIWELLILLLVLLLVFGPKRLPEMGRQLGKGMREFKDSVSGKDDVDDTIDEVAELPPAVEPTTTTPARERDTVS
jgi:sec-independent protein translocase protein TatA